MVYLMDLTPIVGKLTELLGPASLALLLFCGYLIFQGKKDVETIEKKDSEIAKANERVLVEIEKRVEDSHRVMEMLKEMASKTGDIGDIVREGQSRLEHEHKDIMALLHSIKEKMK